MEKIYEFKKGEEFLDDDDEKVFLLKQVAEQGEDWDFPKYLYHTIEILRDFTITISLEYKPELT